MDIGWLQDFLTVAEIGSFTKAAEQRNSSQAAFSRRIQSLEAWLGVTLIDRSVFPTRLTPEGARFRDQAAEILRQVVDARIMLSGAPLARRDLVRVALPHTLATARLPQWWSEWSSGRGLHCQAVAANVHDTVTSFVSGEADLLVCFHHAQQPIHLDPAQYDRLVVGVESLRPYVARRQAQRWDFPGCDSQPLPLLKYSAGAYLGRMVDLITETAPGGLIGHCVFESDMADVLRNMAVAGYGIAWLPGCAVLGAEGELMPVGDERWSMTLSVVAYRDRTNNHPAMKRLWAGIVSTQSDDTPTR